MTERRCPSCAQWYDKSLGDCPECEEPAARHNKWLATASLNNELYKQAESTQPKAQYQKAYTGYRKTIKQAVKEGVWNPSG